MIITIDRIWIVSFIYFIDKVYRSAALCTFWCSLVRFHEMADMFLLVCTERWCLDGEEIYAHTTEEGSDF